MLLDILTIPLNCCVGSCSNWAFDVSVARKEGERRKQEDTGFILFYFLSFLVNHLLFQWNCASSPPLFLDEQVKITQKFFPLFPLAFSVGWNRLLSLAGRDPGAGGGAGKETKALELKARIRKQQDPALTLLEESPFYFLP